MGGSREFGGGSYMGGSFHGGYFLGGRDISIKEAPNFPALFKKTISNLIKKQVFSTESKEQH